MYGQRSVGQFISYLVGMQLVEWALFIMFMGMLDSDSMLHSVKHVSLTPQFSFLIYSWASRR
jgi:hypothetical protein